MQFLNLFLSKTKQSPLYLQLYDYCVKEISSGRMQAGNCLPSKRAAAVQLGVSVNTVDEAYQMLAAEGYVVAKARSGFVVAMLEKQLVPAVNAKQNIGLQTENLQKTEAFKYSFATSDIDTSLFPKKTWNRIFKEVLAQEQELFSLGEAQGDVVLRTAIANYLKGYRGVHCNQNQVVVGAGLEVLDGMLARLFTKDVIALENPCYAKTAKVLQNMGANVVFIDVDSEGMRVDLLQKSKATIAYVTPSHQFPTGAVMPVGRRNELLNWAHETGGVLIEDDYDSEFRFDGRPLPSLQGMDNADRVIYSGTFSRSLAPGLRAAYLVLPPWLLKKWQAFYSGYACTVWRPEQHTLAKFINDGHFAKSINRMRLAYRQRRAGLLNALGEKLEEGKDYILENIHTGLYFVLYLPKINAVQLAENARKNGINLRALQEFVLIGKPFEEKTQNDEIKNKLVVGYGGLPESMAGDAVDALLQIFR